MSDPLVSIVCKVYNHEPYLRQCLDGFVMQKTTFPFEILIHDDASTDGSASIIREYETRFPHLFRPIYQKENQYSKGIGIWSFFQFPRAKGKYIALCEGDDFWTDPYKIQSQIIFLEAHPEYGFVGTRTKILDNIGHLSNDNYCSPPICLTEGDWILYEDVFEYAKFGPVTRTASICFRKSIIEPYISYLRGDIILQTVLAKHSFFALNDNPMAIYRVNVGVSSSSNSLEKQLEYNSWFVSNRRLQMQLFPNEILWNEDSLDDRGDYINLKINVRDLRWKQALSIKKRLRTSEFRNKAFSRFLFGPFSCLVLSFILNYRKTNE